MWFYPSQHIHPNMNTSITTNVVLPLSTDSSQYEYKYNYKYNYKCVFSLCLFTLIEKYISAWKMKIYIIT